MIFLILHLWWNSMYQFKKLSFHTDAILALKDCYPGSGTGSEMQGVAWPGSAVDVLHNSLLLQAQPICMLVQPLWDLQPCRIHATSWLVWDFQQSTPPTPPATNPPAFCFLQPSSTPSEHFRGCRRWAYSRFSPPSTLTAIGKISWHPMLLGIAVLFTLPRTHWPELSLFHFSMHPTSWM